MSETKKRILIAEDAQGLRTLMKKTLKELGQEDVIEAENGKIALEKFNAIWLYDKSLSMIITDIQMPIMGGLELIKNIREKANKEELSILVLSVESDRETILEAIHLGANDYMIKPISKTTLDSKLKKWLK